MKKRFVGMLETYNISSVAGYLQELVYRLSKAGQAIESNDLPAASSVLGASTDTDWVQKANLALNKVTPHPGL